jgi:hypothetical protein
MLPFEYVSVPGTGRDIAFSNLGGLQQVAISGGRIALTAFNESHNVGQVQISWGPIVRGLFTQDTPLEHPHLQLYVYRQHPGGGSYRIGESDIKHFFSSGNADYQHLRPGERDTYSGGLNADQTLYGSVSELDPVTGALRFHDHMGRPDPDGVYNYVAHAHGPLDHRLVVNIADLDPATNPAGTRWYLAGNSFVFRDQDITNNSRWIEFIPSRNAAGNFSFQLLGTGQFNLLTIPDIRLVSIPEPSTWVLLGMGTLGLLGYRWRRSGRAG